jgi:hypothetical protein
MEAFLTKIDTIRENTTAWNEATEKTAWSKYDVVRRGASGYI